MSRDFLGRMIGNGLVGQLIQQIWEIEVNLEGESESQNRKDLQNQMQNQVKKLWEETLSTTPQWPTWNELAAGIYQALESLPIQKPVAPDIFRDFWKNYVHDTLAQGDYLNQQIQQLGLEAVWHTLTNIESPVAKLSELIFPWIYITFYFKLAEPVLTRDDVSFYILDVPVRKDKIFSMPMIASTSWKGNLRWTATKQLVDWWEELDEKEKKSEQKIQTFAQQRLRLTKLFGTEKGEENGISGLKPYLNQAGGDQAKKLYQQMLTKHLIKSDVIEDRLVDESLSGSLYTFPTFFTSIDLEIINPHSRVSRAGERPVLLEIIPAGASGAIGCFGLLYVPIYLVGQLPEVVKRETAEDLNLITRALIDMFTIYGFSAKKTSGFGVAEATLPRSGKVYLKDRPQPYAFETLTPIKGKKDLQGTVDIIIAEILGGKQ